MVRKLLIFGLLILPLVGQAQQRSTNWESGMLENGQKVGVWEYYSYSAAGERVVSQRYDHSARKLLFVRPDDVAYRAEISPGRWEPTLLTQPPWFIGGHEALAGYISKLRYPQAAQERNVQGKVIISFVIDTLGHVSQHRVVRGLGSGCDEEALRVTQRIPDNWVPGRLGSRAVPVVYELPFTFRLN